MKEVIKEKTYTEISFRKLIERVLKDADEVDIRMVWHMNELDDCEQIVEISKENGKFHVKIHDIFC